MISWHKTATVIMKTPKHFVLRVSDKTDFRSIDEFCESVGVEPKPVHRGFMRASGAFLPSNPDVFLWWPAKPHDHWNNDLSPDGMTFTSKSRKEPFSLADCESSVNAGLLSAVFFYKRGKTCGYRLVGIFKINLEKSREQCKQVFDLVSENLKFCFPRT